MNRTLNFKMCSRLIMGNGAIRELPDAARSLRTEKALVVTDPGVVKAGLCERVAGILENSGVNHDIFDKVEPDPRIEIVYNCLTAAKKGGCNVLIGLGGGSSLDIAKVVSIMLTNTGQIADYVGIAKIPEPGISTIMIPTTAGTGSEVTPIAVLSDKTEHLKKGIVSDYLYSDVALVDPELTASLPPHITAYTGVDALTHAIEAYTNRFAQPFIDTFALEATRLIGANLRQAASGGDDLGARYNMSLASLYGGMCLGSVNTAAVHALAYPLGGMFDVPHGIANSLLLPYVMSFNLVSNQKKYADIAAALGKDASGLSHEAAAELSVSAVVELCCDVSIVSRMRDLNVPEAAIDDMAEAAMQVTRLLKNNPREVTVEDARRIYREAY